MKAFILIIIFFAISFAKKNQNMNLNSSIGILENLSELSLAKLLKVRQFIVNLKSKLPEEITEEKKIAR